MHGLRPGIPYGPGRLDLCLRVFRGCPGLELIEQVSRGWLMDFGLTLKGILKSGNQFVARRCFLALGSEAGAPAGGSIVGID